MGTRSTPSSKEGTAANGSTGGFFQRSNVLVDFHLRCLTGLEWKILSVVLRHGDKNGETWVSDETIAEKAGSGVRHVQRAIVGVPNGKHPRAGLIQKGFLQRCSGGGRGKHRTLMVKVPETPADSAVESKSETPAKKDRNPGQKERETPAKKSNPPIPPYKDEQLNEHTNNSSGGNVVVVDGVNGEGKDGGNRPDAVREKLKALKIQEPTRSDLIAEFPGLTVSIIDEIASNIRCGPNTRSNAAVLIKLIRANAGEMIDGIVPQRFNDRQTPRGRVNGTRMLKHTEVRQNAAEDETRQRAANQARQLREHEAAATEKIAEGKQQEETVALDQFRHKFNDDEWAGLVRRFFETFPIAKALLETLPDIHLVREIKSAIDSGKLAVDATALEGAAA
jgi:hypothetical protein